MICLWIEKKIQFNIPQKLVTEEGQRVQQLKYLDYNHKQDEDTSSRKSVNNNDKHHQISN